VLNLVVDLAIAMAMLGMISTGYIIRFPLPPGTNKEWMLWGLTRHQWGDIHFWTSTILLALILGHVCLHWSWIVTVIRQRIGLPRPRHRGLVPDAMLVLLALAAVFGGFAWSAHLGVKLVPAGYEGTCSDNALALSQRQRKDSHVAALSMAQGKPTWNDIYPMFERACLSCHGPQKQRASFRIDQVDKLLSRSEDTPWIIPGKSEESPLILILTGRREIALPARHRLSDADLSRLRKWIDTGAALSGKRDAPES
jgi:hypothetical protein